MINQQLIDNALKLCGKSMEDMEIELESEFEWYCFSIEKFFYFLLSPEFIIAYNHKMIDTMQKQHWGNDIWWTIAEYQSWNIVPIEDLLRKI
jgi:hypothetical protein